MRRKAKIRAPKTNRGKDRCKHKSKKPKPSFDELLAKYLKENEAKCANRSNDDKSSKMPPKHNSRSWNWQGEKFHSAASYSPLRPSVPIPYAPCPTDFHDYSSWGWDDSWAHTPSYFRPYHLEYAAPRKPMLIMTVSSQRIGRELKTRKRLSSKFM